jgi:hypothetical protein
LWTRWARKFFTFKCLWHSNRKSRLVEKKRKWKVKYTLEGLIEEIRSLSVVRHFFILMASQPSTMVASISKKKKDFSLTDQIPLNKLFQSKFHFPFPLFSNKSTFHIPSIHKLKNRKFLPPPPQPFKAALFSLRCSCS